MNVVKTHSFGEVELITQRASRIVEILQQVTTDIEEHLDGVTHALLGEVHDDESVTVYQLHLGREQDTISPFLKWKNHKVE